MANEGLSDRIRRIQEEANLLSEELELLCGEAMEHSRVAQERAKVLSARLEKLKRIASD
jgi:hypothetical protein